MRSAALLSVFLVFACTEGDPAPVDDPGPTPPVVEPGQPKPVVAMKQTSLKKLEDPAKVLERWGPFFAKRFGAAPNDAKLGDVDGDGKSELAAQLEDGNILVFEDTSVDEPKGWAALHVGPQQPPIRIAGGKLRAGTRAPLVFTWDKDAYAFHQDVPAGLEDAAARAKKARPKAFAPGPKWRFGDEAAGGEENLEQHFFGDFDDDGGLELAVLGGGELALYEAEGPPTITKVSYPARRAMVHLGGVNDIKGDWLELVVPEASSQARVFEGGAWKEAWLSD
jgi:hypothetical protein